MSDVEILFERELIDDGDQTPVELEAYDEDARSPAYQSRKKREGGWSRDDCVLFISKHNKNSITKRSKILAKRRKNKRA